jgi:hypothetical protein
MEMECVRARSIYGVVPSPDDVLFDVRHGLWRENLGYRYDFYVVIWNTVTTVRIGTTTTKSHPCGVWSLGGGIRIFIYIIYMYHHHYIIYCRIESQLQHLSPIITKYDYIRYPYYGRCGGCYYY